MCRTLIIVCIIYLLFALFQLITARQITMNIAIKITVTLEAANTHRTMLSSVLYWELLLFTCCDNNDDSGVYSLRCNWLLINSWLGNKICTCVHMLQGSHYVMSHVILHVQYLTCSQKSSCRHSGWWVCSTAMVSDCSSSLYKT